MVVVVAAAGVEGPGMRARPVEGQRMDGAALAGPEGGGDGKPNLKRAVMARWGG